MNILVNLTFCTYGKAKPGKPGLITRKVGMVELGLNPGKLWFNQAFDSRECARLSNPKL